MCYLFVLAYLYFSPHAFWSCSRLFIRHISCYLVASTVTFRLAFHEQIYIVSRNQYMRVLYASLHTYALLLEKQETNSNDFMIMDRQFKLLFVQSLIAVILSVVLMLWLSLFFVVCF